MLKQASLEKLQFDGLGRPQYVVLQGRKLIISTSSLDLARQTLAHAKSGLAMQGLAEPEHCWCMTASFAPELFANLPESLMGKACICAPCARGDSA
ncbi:MAG: hypothetical protein EBU79_00695 [Betaproteobacteria bacterium]|nr:hypothetical protein [Betaproteobacteria bacterium]